MNTISHLIITLGLKKKLRKHKWNILLSAIILGSIAPDIPLYALTILGIIYFRFLGFSFSEAFRHIFDDLYFNNIFWISSHNFLHAPIILLTGIFVFYKLRKKYPRLSIWLIWFLSASLLHSFIDILTHYNDGPLIFFPFNFTFRFLSPISYWDPLHYGKQFFRFELSLDLFLLVYLTNFKKIKLKIKSWLKR